MLQELKSLIYSDKYVLLKPPKSKAKTYGYVFYSKNMYNESETILNNYLFADEVGKSSITLYFHALEIKDDLELLKLKLYNIILRNISDDNDAWISLFKIIKKIIPKSIIKLKSEIQNFKKLWLEKDENNDFIDLFFKFHKKIRNSDYNPKKLIINSEGIQGIPSLPYIDNFDTKDTESIESGLNHVNMNNETDFNVVKIQYYQESGDNSGFPFDVIEEGILDKIETQGDIKSIIDRIEDNIRLFYEIDKNIKLAVWSNERQGSKTQSGRLRVPFLLTDEEYSNLDKSFWEESDGIHKSIELLPSTNKLTFGKFEFRILSGEKKEFVKSIKIVRSNGTRWIIWKPTKIVYLNTLVDIGYFTKSELKTYIGNGKNPFTYMYEKLNFERPFRYPSISGSKSGNSAIKRDGVGFPTWALTNKNFKFIKNNQKKTKSAISIPFKPIQYKSSDASPGSLVKTHPNISKYFKNIRLDYESPQTKAPDIVLTSLILRNSVDIFDVIAVADAIIQAEGTKIGQSGQIGLCNGRPCGVLEPRNAQEYAEDIVKSLTYNNFKILQDSAIFNKFKYNTNIESFQTFLEYTLLGNENIKPLYRNAIFYIDLLSQYLKKQLIILDINDDESFEINVSCNYNTKYTESIILQRNIESKKMHLIVIRHGSKKSMKIFSSIPLQKKNALFGYWFDLGSISFKCHSKDNREAIVKNPQIIAKNLNIYEKIVSFNIIKRHLPSKFTLHSQVIGEYGFMEGILVKNNNNFIYIPVRSATDLPNLFICYLINGKIYFDDKIVKLAKCSFVVKFFENLAKKNSKLSGYKIRFKMGKLLMLNNGLFTFSSDDCESKQLTDTERNFFEHAKNQLKKYKHEKIAGVFDGNTDNIKNYILDLKSKKYESVLLINNNKIQKLKNPIKLLEKNNNKYKFSDYKKFQQFDENTYLKKTKRHKIIKNQFISFEALLTLLPEKEAFQAQSHTIDENF
jgi:hypothetical protein